jgi:endonuclease/exonuclease/phosphatase family metal-dependent hydrolase
MQSSLTIRKFFIATLVLLTLLSYASLRIPPHRFWPAAFLSYGIPLFIGINLILFIISLARKENIAFIWLLLLLIGAPNLFRAIQFNAVESLVGTRRVLSFNASLFYNKKIRQPFSPDIIEWLLNDSSSIKCIQEYITNPKSRELDITGKLKNLGYDGYVFQAFTGKQDQIPGLAIFSKDEIINSGVVWQDSKTLNAGIFADINYKKSIIRVYNIHLTSLNLRARPRDLNGKISYIFYQLKNGSVKRSQQLESIINHMKTSPYPYLVCGDFNETPYSYVYSRMRGELTNAFEERGNGFGFTLNQKPYFLRIDHQFFSKEFKLQQYHVDDTMKISDHFPTYGYYILP